MDDRISIDDEAATQTKARQLNVDDEVLFNGRKRPLTVVGTHERTNSSRAQRQRGLPDHHSVVELKGNNTQYHLITTPGSSFGPMLYKETDWDDETNQHGERPVYSRGEERISEIEIVD